MTRYLDRDRRSWRGRLHALRRRINAILCAALLCAAMLTPSPAAAEGPRICGGRYPVRIPHGCRNITGNGVGCDGGYGSVFIRAAGGRWVGWCVQP